MGGGEKGLGFRLLELMEEELKKYKIKRRSCKYGWGRKEKKRKGGREGREGGRKGDRKRENEGESESARERARKRATA